ncbi:uncharacterized protein ACIQIH_009325 isoform 1-T6 [Cyanocitta cristata]
MRHKILEEPENMIELQDGCVPTVPGFGEGKEELGQKMTWKIKQVEHFHGEGDLYHGDNIVKQDVWAWRGAGFGSGKGPSWAGDVTGGQTATWQPPYLVALGYHQENNWN